MDEEARVGVRWVESKLTHATGQMLVEQFGAINLAVYALIHFEHNISTFHAFWSVVLRKFHVQWLINWLRALTKCQSKINLSGLPTMGCGKY